MAIYSADPYCLAPGMILMAFSMDVILEGVLVTEYLVFDSQRDKKHCIRVYVGKGEKENIVIIDSKGSVCDYGEKGSSSHTLTSLPEMWVNLGL